MPAYPWLFERTLDGSETKQKLTALQFLGVPYSDDDIAGAAEKVIGVTEAEALISYLQTLGTDMRGYRDSQ